MKFQKKLTLITLLTVLLPLIAAMIVVLWFSRERVRILSLELAEKHVQIGSEKLSGYFSQRISEILTYANLPLVQTLDWQTIDPFLSSELKRHNGKYEKLLLGLPSSHYFVTSGGNPSKGGLASFDDSDPNARLKSIANRDYWQHLVAQKNPPAQNTYVSDPIISYTTGVRQVIIGATILSKNDNRVLGMVGGSIQWEQIEHLIADIRNQALKGFGRETILCLVTQKGSYIYHPDPHKIIHMKLDSFDNPVLNDFGEKVTIRTKITEEKSVGLATAGKKMVQGSKGYAFYTAPNTGKEMVIIYAPVSSSKFSMALIIPEKAVMEPVKNLFWVLAAIALISIFVAIAASLIMSGKLTTSIKDLSMVAKDLTKGNLNTRLNPKGSDEISELTSIFNEMASSLENRERELKESEKKYRSLFEESRDAIVITTRDGRFVDINQYTLDLFGYTRQEMMELQVTEIYENPDDRLKFQAEVEKKGSVKDYAVKFRKKDGTPMDCLLTIALRKSGDDGTLGYQGIIRDITAQKAVERQLIQSQKMESIGTLSGGIAHDFNNLLFSIIGNTEMVLQDLPQQSKTRKNIEEIFTAANRAKALVQQILTFSRQSKIEPHPTRIQPIIKESIKLLRATIPTNIEIVHFIDEDCGAILCDSNQIHQIVMNLCTNAYHAMQDNGGHLEIEIKEISMNGHNLTADYDINPGKYLRLRISDTGQGIDENVIERIFDPYFTTKDQGKGTGLGLSVVHGIVKSHQGHILVESRPGKGTTVNIYFPLIEEVPNIPKTVLQNNLPKGTEHILIVDDEPQIVKIQQQMLERLGYTATTQTSSIEALNLFALNPDKYDLVITDMTMPGITGDVLSKELLKIKPAIPIILSTGYNENIDEEKAHSMGIRSFIMKPFRIHQLANLIRNIIENSKSN